MSEVIVRDLVNAIVRPIVRPLIRSAADGSPSDYQAQWILDLVNQKYSGDFTCAATARTCWGYATDGPSTTEGPVLITGIPADVEAITGALWNGSKFLMVDTSGNTLNPFTSKSTPSGTVKVFTSYAGYETSTAYAAGVQVAILTTLGNRVYMTSDGGTSDGTAVVIADSDIGGATVADNDINWTVVGYATISHGGEQLEGPSENLCGDSREPTNGTGAWAQNGTPEPTANEIGIDGGSNLAYTITDDSVGAFENLIYTVSGVDANTNDFTVAYRFKVDNDETRFPGIQIGLTGGTGVNTVFHLNTKIGACIVASGSGSCSVIRRGAFWDFICTVTKINNTGGNINIFPAAATVFGVSSVAATGSCAVDQFDIRDNQSFMDSAIITSGSTLARAATLFQDTTAGRLSASSWGLKWIGTPIGAGQTATIFATYNDANNFTAIIITSTEVILREMVGGVPTDTTETYTHLADTPMEVNAKHDGVKIYVRAFSVGDAVPAYHSVSDTTDSQIAATFENCSDGNDADHFSANDASMQLVINPAQLGL